MFLDPIGLRCVISMDRRSAHLMGQSVVHGVYVVFGTLCALEMGSEDIYIPSEDFHIVLIWQRDLEVKDRSFNGLPQRTKQTTLKNRGPWPMWVVWYAFCSYFHT